jgi:hypothetical protein
MADIKKARAAFLEMVEDLDPDVKCTFPQKATQGNYLIELARGDEKQVVKVNEKDLAKFEDDDDLRQKIEERVMAAIDKLPEPPEEDEDEDEEGEIGELEEGEIDEEFEDEEDEDEFEEDEDEEEGGEKE